MCFLCILSSYLSMFGSDKTNKAVIKVVALNFNSTKEFCVYITQVLKKVLLNQDRYKQGYAI